MQLQLNQKFHQFFLPMFDSLCLNDMVQFYYLVDQTQDYLAFESGYKLVTMLAIVILTLIIYIMISIITKAFKISDIKLKY